jgi:hypothetical protein
VSLQNNWDFGIGSASATRYLVNVQPVIPFSLGTDWNLITRTIVPFSSMDAAVRGGTGAGGIGDIVQSFFFSPKQPVGGWIIGAGPVILYPSASDSALGADRCAAGAAPVRRTLLCRPPVGRSRLGAPLHPDVPVSGIARLAPPGFAE